MEVDLTKVIVRGTYRYIGLIMAGANATKMPIAGMSREAIADALKGTIQPVGKRSLDNIFVVVAPPLRLVFVRPQYTGYRKAAESIFGDVEWKVDYDHVLARSAARKLQYRFVLLVRVTSRVNRSHGRFESAVVQPTNKPDVVFASMRILDKCLGRPALARMTSDPSRTSLTADRPHFRTAGLPRLRKLDWPIRPNGDDRWGTRRWTPPFTNFEPGTRAGLSVRSGR